MSLTLIFVGLLFTLNPMFGLLDVLPDFIGLALAFAGVSRLGMISPELSDAMKPLKWGIFASVARTVLFFASAGLDGIMKLSLTLVFAVIEFGVMVYAITQLGDGLAYLNIRYSGKTEEGSGFKTIGTVFFAVRGLLSVIPMIGVLSDGADKDGAVVGESIKTEWTDYTLVLNATNAIITLIFAGFWVWAIYTRVGVMMKDKELVASLNSAYAERKLAEPAGFIRRRLLYGFSALSLGTLFLVDLTADGINYLPDFVFGFCALTAVLFFSEYCRDCRRAYISGGVYTAFSLASWIYSFGFAKRRYFMEFDRLMIMFPGEYWASVILSVLEAAALIVFVKYLADILVEVSRGHVGLNVSEEYSRTLEQNASTVRSLGRKLKAYFIAICVLAASGAVFIATMHPFPEYWMIHMVLNIAVFAWSVHIISTFTSEINMRYEKPGE